MSLLLCNCLRDSDEGRLLSSRLDKDINQWMKQYNRTIKLLLLGGSAATLSPDS